MTRAAVKGRMRRGGGGGELTRCVLFLSEIVTVFSYFMLELAARFQE